MCRLTAYKGRPMLLGDIIARPDNSLILQSRDAAYHPGVVDKTHRRNILVNGDGFGVAWYGTDLRKGACCFKFVTPAWSNSNLRNIGEHVASPLIFAHIRAASSGHDPLERVAVSLENCHPFRFSQFTFMHNGGVPQFSRIKLRLLNLLSERFFAEIKGSTDSEHIFALFLTCLHRSVRHPEHRFTVEEQAAALSETISILLALCSAAEVEEACSLNLTLTDGINIIATRFRNGPQHPPSLYYNFGSEFVCEEGHFYAAGINKKPDSVVISSAPLSRVKPIENKGIFEIIGGAAISEEDVGAWILMPKDHMLICRGDSVDPHKIASIELQPIIVNPHSDVAESRELKETSTTKSTGLNKAINSSIGSSGLSPSVPRPKVMRFRCKL